MPESADFVKPKNFLKSAFLKNLSQKTKFLLSACERNVELVHI